MYLKRLLSVLGWLLSGFFSILGQVLNVLSIAEGRRTIGENWADSEARYSEEHHEGYGDRGTQPPDYD